MSESTTNIIIPEDVITEEAYVSEWLFPEGAKVSKGDCIALVDCYKSIIEVDAPADGYLSRLVEEGSPFVAGLPLGIISTTRPEGTKTETASENATVPPSENVERVITEPAQRLMDEHGFVPEDFEKTIIRSRDVLQRVTQSEQPAEVTKDESLILKELERLRREMASRFNRHVPMGDLFSDRWELARDLGFGEKSSIFDQSLVLGDVSVGPETWIGPFTVLDGAHAKLCIGAHCSIGSGCQIYTHDTINWALTGGAEANVKETTIGSCCFIAPLSVIGPGTTIGDHSFVASGSFVQGSFPPYSYIAGSPAKRVGSVHIKNGRAIFTRKVVDSVKEEDIP